MLAGAPAPEKKRNIFVADILSLSYGKCLCPWVREVFVLHSIYIQHLYIRHSHQHGCSGRVGSHTPSSFSWLFKKGNKKAGKHGDKYKHTLTRDSSWKGNKNKSMHINLWKWFVFKTHMVYSTHFFKKLFSSYLCFLFEQLTLGEEQEHWNKHKKSERDRSHVCWFVLFISTWTEYNTNRNSFKECIMVTLHWMLFLVHT